MKLNLAYTNTLQPNGTKMYLRACTPITYAVNVNEKIKFGSFNCSLDEICLRITRNIRAINASLEFQSFCASQCSNISSAYLQHHSVEETLRKFLHILALVDSWITPEFKSLSSIYYISR